MHRFASKLSTTVSYKATAGFHTSAVSAAITRFNLPAMSPTMTEGTIHKWMKKEGDSFAAGDVLLELETDKAQIDVEAAEDGVLAKIVLQNGKKGSVNSLIALIAEEGDDISNVEIPAEEESSSTPAAAAAAEEEKPTSTSAPTPTASPISHHDIDTSKLKKPLSPAVLSLVLKYGIKDVDSIKASGNGGRILKGDVLAHLGLIKPKPAPKATLSIAPPRDQIVFAKTEKKQDKKEVAPPLPTFISKQVVVDDLFSLRQSLNEQHGTHVSINDFIAKAAERALQDVTANKINAVGVKNPIIYKSSPLSFSEKYTGGQFKVFNLTEPTYDFITDSYQNSKPYVMQVSGYQRIVSQQKKRSSDHEMLDLIDYLGGASRKQEPRRIQLSTKNAKLDFTQQPKQTHAVEIKLDGGKPGKILNDQKANAFLERVEFYVRNPSELVL
ncbi:uncharacterized protein ATC70_010213 [Mucor velutinosus]|uniref:Dihydrolipoamide acetyltransferase component of pyruvate dehydrogenase complex n=1 Tax=Mucor velutinosus TaxID=708070 RepID=A0AAN7DP51_9FUNG|nr:hypothetical protein ATC70_010213 [Mucor velutinosus]